ncbi:MAG: dual specificity protein phosphatase [Halobacteria archaeon]|nr:dual specificity protein phosphatase [Halobacteria archaeon]
MPESSYDLYIGDIKDAGDKEQIHDNDISVILSLTNRIPKEGYPPRVYVVEYPMSDGPRCDQLTFRQAVDHLTILLQEGETVLVHCSRGESRSVAVSAAAISMIEDVSFDDALEIISKSRDKANPHPSLVECGKETVNELNYIAN